MDGAYDIASPEPMTIPSDMPAHLAQQLLSGEDLPAFFEALEAAIVNTVETSQCLYSGQQAMVELAQSLMPLAEMCLQL